jgi:hypothetical protein
MPLSRGLAPQRRARRAPVAEVAPEEARAALQNVAAVTTSAIAQRVVELGGDLAFNLVFKTEWSAVIQSAGLLSKDLGKLLDKVKEGAGAFIQRVVTTASKTLLNVFDKILALLGKDAENEARKRVQGWLEQIQQDGKIALFEQLVGKLYKVEALQAALPGWLEKSTVDADKISATAADVGALPDKFTVLVGRINSIGDVIGLARFVQVQFPQVLAVVTAIRVALLAVLVYAGWDYIGYQQPKFLNLTQGVGELIQANLGVTG